uniref:Transposase n=1 Tax=Heterorhabditis bacteriophora TaxID=37862 RepID=A0A1I7XJN7_HETBA
MKFSRLATQKALFQTNQIRPKGRKVHEPKPMRWTLSLDNNKTDTSKEIEVIRGIGFRLPEAKRKKREKER